MVTELERTWNVHVWAVDVLAWREKEAVGAGMGDALLP